MRAAFEKHDFTPPVISGAGPGAAAGDRSVGAPGVHREGAARARRGGGHHSGVARDREGVGQEAFKPSRRHGGAAGDDAGAAGKLGQDRNRRPGAVAGRPGDVPGRTQNYTIQVEPTFFVGGSAARRPAIPDTAITIQFRVPVKADGVRGRAAGD